ncbi:MAG: XdhC family protein [Pyrinomonadaceae bacterium]
MSKDLELWHFIASRLKNDERVMLLVVADSHGSSPGRAGYKMAVVPDGELCGSIGGGVMEVQLVEQAKAILSEPGAVATGFLVEQVHQKNVPNSSGMICSGRQTVIRRQLTARDATVVCTIIAALESKKPASLTITQSNFTMGPPQGGTPSTDFEKLSETDFIYAEQIGPKNKLFIIGGGHCALALSEVMSLLGFHISIFDDRPDLNTLEKNRFANRITVIDSYETIGDHVPSGDESYVVVMTIGYKFDEMVMRNLFDKNFRYFGVLGSKAKMKTLLKALEKDGFNKDRLAKIRTPVGIAINSRTPEEIAVSIAAEIIAVKNS